MRLTRELDDPLVIRAAPGAWVVFGLMWGPIVLLCLAATVRRPDFWPGLVCALCALALSYTWIGAFRLELTQDQLSFRSLSGRRRLTIADVARVEIGSGRAGRNAGFTGYGPRLVLFPAPSVGGRPIVVNLKVFRLSDVRTLLELLGAGSSRS